MYVPFIFLLYAISLGICTSQNSTRRDKSVKIKSHPISIPRQSHGSGRLSLINYRFNRRPKRKHLDAHELRLVLGTSFDSKFMSIEQPPELKNGDTGVIYVVKKDSWRYDEMLQELKSTNLSQELQQIAGKNFQVGPEYVRTVEKWLMKKASCPVRYAWEDIGAMFWPRYIRRGECSTGLDTCSWPSGMHCVPSGTTEIQILRWQCKSPKGKGRKRGYRSSGARDDRDEEKPLHMKCNWVRVPYPITSECMCTC